MSSTMYRIFQKSTGSQSAQRISQSAQRNIRSPWEISENFRSPWEISKCSENLKVLREFSGGFRYLNQKSQSAQSAQSAQRISQSAQRNFRGPLEYQLTLGPLYVLEVYD